MELVGSVYVKVDDVEADTVGGAAGPLLSFLRKGLFEPKRDSPAIITTEDGNESDRVLV